jgi:tyrosyl-tRNA synthetase
MSTHITDPAAIAAVLSRGVTEVLPNKQALAQLMSERPIRVYLGIDPTGAFLTLGHSVVLRKLQQFAELGHEVILLIGNATVRIGDPTGRDSTRPVLTDAEIEENFKHWQAQASAILDFEKIQLRRNGDWLDKLNFADIISLMAKTTVQQLLERDMFQNRMQNGLPIHGHEIMYPLLQGYDSVAMDVDLEIGGSDQTFNMMMGRTLQRAYNNKEKWVLSTPIINGTDGRKMSKSYGNYVALTEEPTSMFGKLMSIADEQIVEYFTLLTDVPEGEIVSIQQAIAQGENPMNFKKTLASTITEMYHSPEAALAAREFFERTVQEKQLPESMPVVHVTAQSLTILELAKRCVPEESNTNLRRLIEQSALELLPSGERPTDPTQSVTIGADTVLRVGKRRYFRVTLNRVTAE